MKLRILFIFLFLSLFFLGCKKKIETKYILVPDDFKAWSVFQKDSYWIYLNENTNQADSTFVTKCDRALYTDYDPYIHVYKENYYVRLSSIFLNKFWIVAQEGSSAQLYIDSYHSDGFILSTDRIENPFVHEIPDYNSVKSKVIEVIPNLQINNNTFTNVYHILVYFQKSNGDSVNDNFYLAKKIGLIKYKSRIGSVDTTWSLLRYHTIQ
jgi:hypothetical protein